MTTAPEPPLRGVFLPPPRAFLLVEGADRLRFLNGQVTNDVRLAESGQCVYSAVLNAKGQLDAVCHIHPITNAYLLDADPALEESLLARLDRYLIADEVTLSNVSDRWHLVHALGLTPQELDLPQGSICQPVNRFGAPGWDLLCPTRPEVPAALVLPAATIENFRIANGMPAWGTELVPGLLPPEAGLDRSAISYDKGCYLGQEVISRMKRAGKTNRHLVLMEVPAGTTAGPLLSEGAPAGEITSVASGCKQGPVPALGYRQRKFEKLEEFQLPNGAIAARVLRRLA